VADVLRDLSIRVGYQIEAGPLAEANQQVDAFKANAVKSERGVQTLGAQVAATGTQVAQSTSSMATGFDALNAKFQANEKSLERVSKALKDNRTLIAGAFAATAGTIGFAVRRAADFEEEMSRVGALARANDQQLARLSRTARDLGATTIFSASQAAEGMGYLALAGFEVEEIISAMPGMLDAAAAAKLDLGSTADIVSGILRGFNLEASESGRVADVLSVGFTSSNTDLQMLGETMKYAAPVAASLNISLEETVALAGLLGNAGIQASQAGTTLRSMMSSLSGPTGAAAEVMKALGIRITDTEGRMLPMADIIEQLSIATANMGEAQRSAAIQALFGERAFAGVLALMAQGPDRIRQFTAQLEASGGAARTIAAKQMDNLHGSLEELGSAFEEAQISIGTAFIPVIRLGADILRGVIDVFNMLPGPIKTVIAVALGFGAVLSGLLLVASFMVPQMIALAKALPLLKTGFLTAIPAIKGFAAAGWAAVAPWLPIIGIVLGVAAAIAAVVLVVQDIYSFFAGKGDTITGRIVQWAKSCTWLQATFRGIGAAVSWVKNGIAGLIGAAGPLRTVLVLPFLPVIGLVKGVIWLFNQARTAIQGIGSPIQWLRAQFAGLGKIVAPLKTALLAPFMPIIVVVKGIAWLFGRVRDAIMGVGRPVQAVSAGIGGLVNAARPIVSVLLAPLKAVQFVASGIGKLFGWVKSGIGQIASVGKTAAGQVRTVASSIREGLGTGIRAGVQAVKAGVNAARERLSSLGEGVRSLSSQMLETAGSWAKGLFGKLGSGLTALRQGFQSLTQTAVGAGEGFAETTPRFSGIQAIAQKLGLESQSLRTTFASAAERIKSRFGQLISTFRQNPVDLDVGVGTSEEKIIGTIAAVDATKAWLEENPITIPDIKLPVFPDLLSAVKAWVGEASAYLQTVDLGVPLGLAIDRSVEMPKQPLLDTPTPLSIATQGTGEQSGDAGGYAWRQAGRAPIHINMPINIDARGATENDARAIAIRVREEVRRVLEELIGEDYASVVLEGAE